jgi:hypothetical protein
MKDVTFDQSRGSGFIEFGSAYGSGSSMSSESGSGSNPDPGFDYQKMKDKKNRFDEKLQFTYVHPSYRRSLQPSKENSQHFKK